MTQWMLEFGLWFLCLSKASLNIWKVMVHITLKPGLENFEHYFSGMWDEYNCVVVEHSLTLPFFGVGKKTDFFQSCGHCCIFQICWHIACSTFTASSFRIWTNSTGIPSHPLALFIVMLPKAHLLHIPGCLALGEWSHHCDYLGHEDLFCIVLLCILATSSKYLPLLLGPYHICLWNVPLVSLIFLKRSLVFPILLFSSTLLLCIKAVYCHPVI